jgi:excisionase family DNA binding protein
MESLVFTQLSIPEVRQLLRQELEVFFSTNKQQHGNVDHWFDINDLCEYLPGKPSKATIYAYIAANNIPFHKGAKKLRFLKSEIDDWLKQSKKSITQPSNPALEVACHE